MHACVSVTYLYMHAHAGFPGEVKSAVFTPEECTPCDTLQHQDGQTETLDPELLCVERAALF